MGEDESRWARAAVVFDDETLARLLGLSPGVVVDGVWADSLRDSVVVNLRGDGLPYCAPGNERPRLGLEVRQREIDGGTWFRLEVKQ